MSYVTNFKLDGGRTEMESIDGVAWFDAPRPRRWHKCWPQSIGWINYFTRVERCPCGAIRMDGGTWLRKNERKS